jgi:curved DNA-binding protein CbpA
MGRNLYDVLRITKFADLDAIRASFRKIAKEVHPDHGGSAEEFATIKRAYDILSDPEARAHYDATGEVPDREPDNQEAMALNAIANMIQTVIATEHATGDPLQAMRTALANDTQNAQRAIEELERKARRCEKLGKRFKTTRGLDPIGAAFAQQIEQAKSQIAGHKQAIATMERALAILKDYQFEREVVSDYMPYQERPGDGGIRMIAEQQQAAPGWGFWGR